MNPLPGVSTGEEIEQGAPIRTLIVDDEPLARREMRHMLRGDARIVVMAEAGTGLEAVELIEQLRPDLVMLDVELPEGDGFEVVERIGIDAMPVIIFVTAHGERAIEAFQVRAVDYLLKPCSDVRFQEALSRAKRAVGQRRHLGLSAVSEESGASSLAEIPNSASPSERVLLRSAGELYFLHAGEIDWIEADGDYMKFHVAGKIHLQRETMAKLEARLNPRRFLRIHRSTIVNVERVRKLKPGLPGEYHVVLSDGTSLKLSRSYYDRLQRLLGSVG